MPLSSMYKKECVQNLGEAQTAALHLGHPNSDLGHPNSDDISSMAASERPICILCKGSGELWRGVLSDPCPLCEESMESESEHTPNTIHEWEVSHCGEVSSKEVPFQIEGLIKDSEANASVQEGLSEQMEPVGEPFQKVGPVTSLPGLRQELIVDFLPESESKHQRENTNASEQFDINTDVDIRPSDTSVIARWDFDWDPFFPNENSERDTAHLPIISSFPLPFEAERKRTKRRRRRPRRRGLDHDSHLATHEISSAASLAVASVSGGEDISMNSSPLNSNSDCLTSVELNANAQDSSPKADAPTFQSLRWADLDFDEDDWITPGSRLEINVQQSYLTTPASNWVSFSLTEAQLELAAPLASIVEEDEDEDSDTDRDGEDQANIGRSTFAEGVRSGASSSQDGTRDYELQDQANTGRSTFAEGWWDTWVRSGASSSQEAPTHFGVFAEGELQDLANTGRSTFAEGLWDTWVRSGASSSQEAPTRYGVFADGELEDQANTGRSTFAEGWDGKTWVGSGASSSQDGTRDYELQSSTRFGVFADGELESFLASSSTAGPDRNEDTTAPPESSRTGEVSSPKASSSTAIVTDGVVGASSSGTVERKSSFSFNPAGGGTNAIVSHPMDTIKAEAAEIVATAEKDREERLQARQEAEEATTPDALQALINARLAKRQASRGFAPAPRNHDVPSKEKPSEISNPLASSSSSGVSADSAILQASSSNYMSLPTPVSQTPEVVAPDLSYSHCVICGLEYRVPEPRGGMCCGRPVQDGRSVQAVAFTPTSAGTDEPPSFGFQAMQTQATPMSGWICNYPNPHWDCVEWEAQFEAGGQDADLPQANISDNRGKRTNRRARKGLNVAEELRTTVMMSNIPCNYILAALLRLLFPFLQEINLVYLPLDLDYRKKSNLGYAFVNLTSHEAANRFRASFERFCQWDLACQDNWGRFSGKICKVTWSVCQGLVANIENYRNCSAMHGSVPKEGKPTLLMNGEEIPFPPPTKKVRAPYRSKKA